MIKTSAPANYDKFTLFYGGIFSQWYQCSFTIDGIGYNCAEQYMMAQKASLFGDHVRYDQIMASRDPSEQKALGKLVRGFSKSAWEAVARDVVFRASMAKFTSSAGLLKGLLKTRGTLLVEASPTDVIWGIGLGEYDERALNPAEWRGMNWLGQVLTDAREQLLSHDEVKL